MSAVLVVLVLVPVAGLLGYLLWPTPPPPLPAEALDSICGNGKCSDPAYCSRGHLACPQPPSADETDAAWRDSLPDIEDRS